MSVVNDILNWRLWMIFCFFNSIMMRYIMIEREGKKSIIWECERKRHDMKSSEKYESHMSSLKHKLVIFSDSVFVFDYHNLWFLYLQRSQLVIFFTSLQLSQLVIPSLTEITTYDILHISIRIITCDLFMTRSQLVTAVQ